MKKLFGVGVYDGGYVSQKYEKINGKWSLVWRCPFYSRWKSMLERCYSSKRQMKNPTYKDCSVCDEWLVFSNFKGWMKDQDWEENHLDKDILDRDNKTYSPNVCVFVKSLVNTFLTDSRAKRGSYPIGVSFRKDVDKFISHCNNPFTKKKEHLGFFTCPDQAHEAWRKRKHELACQLADSEYVTDERVANALRQRYA